MFICLNYFDSFYLYIIVFAKCACSNEGKRYRVPPNFPARFRPSDVIEFGSDRKVVYINLPLIHENESGHKPITLKL